MAEQEAQKEQTSEEAAEKPKGKKRLLLIIGILALVAGGGGGAALFLLKGSKPETPASPPAEPESAANDPAAPSPAAATNEATPASPPAETPAGPEASQAEPAKDGTDGAFGATFAFKPFNLNLGNPLENRYIRIELALEYRGGESQKEEITAKELQLRDAVISIISSKSREFLLSVDGKERLRYEVTTQINQLLKKSIENVYITDMIIE